MSDTFDHGFDALYDQWDGEEHEYGWSGEDCNSWIGGFGRRRRRPHYEGMEAEELTDTVFDLLLAPPVYRTVLDSLYGVRRDF